MPIAGLSNREAVDPRFVEIGRLRKGAEKQGNQPGKDLSYFRYVANSRYPKSAEVFAGIYGDEPTELEVFFPHDEMERVFSSWREAYGQNRLCKLRCDGARWHDWIEGDRHYHSEAGRECDLDCRDSENKCPKCPCQYSGRLSVILKPMWKAGQIGLVTVLTSSINDIAHLAAKLVQWEPLTGKPFTLWRAPERIGVPIKGQRAAKDSDLLHLELTDEWMQGMFALAQGRAQAQLLAPTAQYDESLPFDEEPISDYDAEYIGPEEFRPEVEEEGAGPAGLVEHVAAPGDLNRKNIVEKAIAWLPAYTNAGQVKQAMLALYGARWERSRDWELEEAWFQLQDHAAAPRE